MMKKLIAGVVALMMTASLAAAEGSTDTASAEGGNTAMAGMANPWVEVESIEELNEKTELSLQLPGVMGVGNVSCQLLQTEDQMIAQVSFELNGQKYILRGSPYFDQDISGIYLADGKTAFEGREAEERTVVITDDVKASRWMNISGQYVLETTDAGEIDEETFNTMTDEMEELTNPFQPVELTGGTYYDSTSQRATAEVTPLGNDTYAIEIHWADSATVDNVWTMTAVMSEDGLLSYTDCVSKRVETDADGKQKEYVADLIPEGFFTPVDENTFNWDGAADEGCRACVFVLPE